MPDFLGRRYRFHYLTAINLLESMGVPLGDIRVRAAGEYENYRGDIRSQDPAPGTAIPAGSIITLNVGCGSAVDFMPYQFFYGLQGMRDSDDTWETAARSVMAPFDTAMIRYTAAMRMQALRYDFGITDGAHIKRFMELFEYKPGDEARAAGKTAFLAAILPSLHLWGGNPSAVTLVLKRLFGYNVRLKENLKATTPIPEDIRYRLGSKAARLGSETVIGRSFEECDSRYEVEFVGVPPGEVRDLLPGGRTRRRIEAFLDFCTPGDIDRTIAIKVERPAARSCGEKHLGYSTYL
ncbi:MAG: type VI secretion system baseplate subunit TssG [Candidatus Krumholzibacteria bacterium]|nr:type VI secretion system baseplate subunit TssG [Candidatus Krumholzibacteria bacterium]